MSNYKEFIASVVNEADYNGVTLTKKDAAIFVKSVFDIIKEMVAQGEIVSIPKFAKFFSVERDARVGRNPQTGAEINIPAKLVPRAKLSSVFKEYVGK